MIADSPTAKTVDPQEFILLLTNTKSVHDDANQRDVTERTKEQETWKALVESAPDAMVVVNHRGKIVLVNTQALKLFGYTQDELMDKNIEILVPERFRAQHAVHHAEYMASPRFRAMGTGLELYGLRKDGKEFPVDISLSPVRTPEGTLFASAIRDATERKETEKKLTALTAMLGEMNASLEQTVKKQTALLEKSHQDLKKTQDQFYQAQKMETLGALAGGMAHDLGNFLALILLETDLALSKIGTQNPVYQVLERIRNTCNQAHELIQQVLLFSRRQPAHTVLINLNEVVSNLVKILLGVIGERYSLTMDLEPNLPVIHANAGHVQQILINLILNARDAMAEGGPITIKTNKILVTEKDCKNWKTGRPGKFVRLAVKDQGTGMDSQTISRIFDPFFTTKGPEKGTGLGLSVVQGIVESYQGWIHAESSTGQGSVFNVYFPGMNELPG